MKKIFLAFAFLLFSASISPVFADDRFSVSSDATFTVEEDTTTTVTQRISIKNNTEYYYTPSYGMTIGYEDVENVTVTGPSGSIPFTTTDTPEGKRISITFSNRIVGLNRQNDFSVSFSSKEIAHHNGAVWEIQIPGIRNVNDFEMYKISVTVPELFGKPSIIKPQKDYLYSGNSITFNKDSLGESGIFIVYGNEQYYSFNLDYHITNTNLFPIKTEIALPPTTNYQEVVIESIDPLPSDVYQDEDGNWLAEYNLTSQQKRTVNVKGKVKVSHTPKIEILSTQDRKKYITQQKNWELTSPEIKNAVKDLNTAKDIYEYVVKTLTYDYEKVAGENIRLGAKKSLQNPTNAVCLEFTDLFVALARAKGIPARSIEGYAHTENNRLRPLSLVKDVLHAWPEYYDDEKKMWIMVDPTWGNTTGGTDYFDVFDFDHIVFVRKGINSEYPIPAGGYKFTEESKDIDIRFADKDTFQKTSYVSVTSNLPDHVLSAFPARGHVVVQNTGNTLLRNKSVKITTELPLSQNEFAISNLPPFGKMIVPLNFGRVPLLTNTIYPVTIQFEDYTENKNITVSIFPHQSILLLGGGILSGIICISIIAGITRRIYLQKRSK
jgi:transglutaminase-like putative cysteine protease